MINVNNITKNFDGYIALKGLNLTVESGSIYGLVGVNGSGKTTAIKHITGVFRPDSGSITIDNQDVYNNAPLKLKIGYIPDELYFFPNYTMKLLRRFYKNMYENWNDQRYTGLTQLFSLDEKRRVKKFSKGMQKQVAFILAMSIMPQVLILDEPIDGLDPIVRKEILSHIKEDVKTRGLTVLVSSHNLKEMEGLCNAIGVIKNGKMVIERDINNLKSDVHKIQVAFNEPPSLDGLDILFSEKRGSVDLMVTRGKEDEIDSIIKQQNPIIYDKLPLSLEEIFMYEGADK